MKTKLLLLACVVALASCEKKKGNAAEIVSDETKNFNNHILGYWASFELVSPDGHVVTENLNTLSLFGVYNGAVQFKEDRTYVPYSWYDDRKEMKTAESGKYEYETVSNELELTGGFMDMKFKIEKLENEELWLRVVSTSPPGNLIKLRRD